MLEDIIGDAECPVKHQTSYLLNQIDYLKSRLIALEVDAVFNQEELEDESVSRVKDPVVIEMMKEIIKKKRKQPEKVIEEMVHQAYSNLK